MIAFLVVALLGFLIGVLLSIPVTAFMYIAGVRNGFRYAIDDALKLAGLKEGDADGAFSEWIRPDLERAKRRRLSIRDELRADPVYQAQLEAQRSNGKRTP